MKVWILTYEVNDYDQCGEYFIEAYAERPTFAQLIAEDVPQNRIRHVMNGGGRVGYEETWFFLKERELK